MDIESQNYNNSLFSQASERASVLLIEDSVETANALSELLKNLGYGVDHVSDVKSAITYLTHKIPDVILCDLQLPSKSGEELFLETRKHNLWNEIPFVFITGSNDSSIKSKAIKIGADDLLRKPIDPSELKATLDGKLNNFRFRKEQERVRFDNFKKRIIHTLSHEFRTPLVAITTGTELLIDEYRILQDNQVITLLRSILKGGQRLERLVEDFMVMQQIDIGYAEKSFDQFKCKVPVSELFDLLNIKVSDYIKTQYANPDFQIEIDKSVEHKMLDIYVDQIIDALFRFIDNGLKFSAPNSKVHVNVSLVKKTCLVEIRDWGSGFMGNTNARLKSIQPFEQINRELYEQQGCGLGLSIASYFLSLHQAEVRILKPTDSTGTIIEVKIPLA